MLVVSDFGMYPRNMIGVFPNLKQIPPPKKKWRRKNETEEEKFMFILSHCLTKGSSNFA